MRTLRGAKARIALLLAVAGAIVVPVLAATGSAAPGRQRIMIDETLRGSNGVFVLRPLTAGPLEADSGTVVFVGGLTGSGSRNGQEFKRYAGVETFHGKLGVLRVPNSVVSTDAPHGYTIGVGTWRIRGGAGAYSGVRGGGRQSFVGTADGATYTRYEGYVIGG